MSGEGFGPPFALSLASRTSQIDDADDLTWEKSKMAAIYSRGIYGDRTSNAGMTQGNAIHNITQYDTLEYWNDFKNSEDISAATVGPIDIGTTPTSDVHELMDDTANGIVRVDAGSTGNESKGRDIRYGGTDGAGEIWRMVDNAHLTFVCRIAKLVADEGSTYVGLGEAAAMLTTAGAVNGDDYAGFWTAEDSTALKFVSGRTDGQTSSLDMGITLADAGFVTVGFRMVSTDISDDASNGSIEVFKFSGTSGLTNFVPAARIRSNLGYLGDATRIQGDIADTINSVTDLNLSWHIAAANGDDNVDSEVRCDFIHISTPRT